MAIFQLGGPPLPAQINYRSEEITFVFKACTDSVILRPVLDGTRAKCLFPLSETGGKRDETECVTLDKDFLRIHHPALTESFSVIGKRMAQMIPKISANVL